MSGFPKIESLEAVHTFPGRFVVKVIGDSNGNFAQDAQDAAGVVTGKPDEVKVSTRLSSKGNHVSVTLDVYVDSPEQVQDLYAKLQTLEALRFIL